MGIEAVEPYVPLTNKEIAAFESAFEEFKALGLSVPSAHISPALFGRRPAKISRNLVLIQDKTDISVFVFSGMFSKESAAQRWGRLLGDVARAVSDSGITILYHNHDMELRPVGADGRTAMDTFLDAAGSDVMLQLDIGWAGVAGNEVDIAKKYADRIVEMHCKDFYKGARGKYSLFTMPKRLFAPIGDGVIKTKEVLDMRDDFSNFNGAVLIDQDHSTGDLLSDIATGCHNLQEYFDEQRTPESYDL